MFPIIQQLYSWFAGSNAVASRAHQCQSPTHGTLLRRTSGSAGLARSTDALSRGHNGMASRRTSLQDRERVASHADEAGKIQTCASYIIRNGLGLPKTSVRILQVFVLLFCYMDCLQNRPDLPTLQRDQGSLARAPILQCCIPDLRSVRVECKVHAHRQRHRYSIPNSRGRIIPLISRYNVTLVRVGHSER